MCSSYIWKNEVDVYEEQSFIERFIMVEGEFAIFEAVHGYEILEENTKIFETKMVHLWELISIRRGFDENSFRLLEKKYTGLDKCRFVRSAVYSL